MHAHTNEFGSSNILESIDFLCSTYIQLRQIALAECNSRIIIFLFTQILELVEWKRSNYSDWNVNMLLHAIWMTSTKENSVSVCALKLKYRRWDKLNDKTNRHQTAKKNRGRKQQSSSNSRINLKEWCANLCMWYLWQWSAFCVHARHNAAMILIKHCVNSVNACQNEMGRKRRERKRGQPQHQHQPIKSEQSWNGAVQ